MANIKSFPNNQDEYIGAEYVMKWLHGRTSGVFAADNNAAVAAVQGAMAVTVSDGLGWITNIEGDGVVWWNDVEKTNGAKLQLSIDAADSALNRIDRVIVEWKTTNYADLPEIKVLKGTTSSTATAPTLTNNSTVRQISLAQISVAAGTTALTASMITDERLDASVCGIVTENVTADTSMINAQYQDAVNRLKQAIQEAWDGKISNGTITRAKLAQDALYSPLAYTQSGETLTSARIGFTLRQQWNEDATYILTQSNSASMPVGSVIAICNYGYAGNCLVQCQGGVRFAISGKASLSKDGTVKIKGAYSKIALEKYETSSSDGDVWIVIGNAEVVA